MGQYTIEQYEHAGCTISIEQDLDPMNPRDWSNLGVMSCHHPRYTLGDDGEDFRDIVNGAEDWLSDLAYDVAEELRIDDYDAPALTWELLVQYIKRERGATVVLPLCLYDHSGITMYVGRRGGYPFDSAGWDTSEVGVIFDTAETRQTTGAPLESIEQQLRAEVQEYDYYLTGYACGFVVERKGEMIESVWGFMGDWGVEEAKRQAEEIAEHERENATRLDFYASAH